MAAERQVIRFRVELLDIRPPVWRRIEVRADATFWALHVALQNAMGWTDSHLHEFELPSSDTGDATRIGMPDPEGDDDREIVPEHEQRLDRWLHHAGERFFYDYDFGDDWRHEITVEAIEPAATGTGYPRCLAGERACPPEDVGGPLGYQQFLEALADPSHPEHETCRSWIGGGFEPEGFDPAGVRFESPAQRWREVYGSE